MILSELKKLIWSITHWIIALIVIATFFFITGPKTIHFKGRELLVPSIQDRTFTVEVLSKMQSDLIPQNVDLIVTSPLDAFLVEIQISLFLSFCLCLPIFLYGVLRYVHPALKEHERGGLYKIIVPSVVLFIGGCLFAYLLLLPATIKILYSYTTHINVVPFFLLFDFISLVLTLMFVTGCMFLMPVLMALLSRFGFIKFGFWKKHWRYIIFAFVIATAIITPDGTGITMAMLAIPLCLLYILGMLLSARDS
ncbi:MAG: Sec-independent protein translocase subunit TatC [Candidatus Paceibacter sp.]|jgi:sec-independent protein translocase protein TatC|nr:Sec-independent protein translocase subunit TatC [Candidatus Paceibacter sp.]